MKSSQQVDCFNSRPAVLLLGNYRPTLAIARALQPLGYSIVVAGEGGEGAAEHSRHVDRIMPAGDLERGALPAWLTDGAKLSKAGIDMVIPVTEAASRKLAANASSLSADITWVTPSAEAVQACLDKPGMFARCQSLGVPTEPFANTTSRDLSDAIDSVGLPCVIRPLDSTRRIGGEKAIFVETRADLEAEALNALPPSEPLVLQRKASGTRHNLYFASAEGRLVGVCEARIDRTDRADGSGLAVEGVTLAPNADLVRWTEALTQSLAYTGIGCAQFLVDARSGATMFLEINPRVPGNHAIAEAAGLPLARLSVDLASGRAMPEEPIVGRAGLRFAWTYGDLRGLREAIRSRSITFGAALTWLARAGAMALKADIHMTWSWSDPRPTLVLFARQLGGLRLMSRRRAALIMDGAP